MDYDELVQKNIAGEISDLEFLLAQEELAQAYQCLNGDDFSCSFSLVPFAH